MYNQFSPSQQYIKSRWRNSLNQFSKLQEETKMCVLDTNLKKANFLKLKMKNRLGQVDPDFMPSQAKEDKQTKNNQKCSSNKLSSTNNGSNLVESVSGIGVKGYPVIFESDQHFNADRSNPQQTLKCQDQIRQKSIFQENAQYNQQKYNKDMGYLENSAKISKYFIQSINNKQESKLATYCFHCDGKIEEYHSCKWQLNSLPRVDRALLKLKSQIQHEEKRIFSIFLHNLTLEEHELEQLINHAKVLKTAHSLSYDPKQSIYRMRLMNLLGKKIGIILNMKSQKE